jgi:hypothetical protein
LTRIRGRTGLDERNRDITPTVDPTAQVATPLAVLLDSSQATVSSVRLHE